MSSARPRLSMLEYLDLGLVFIKAYWSAALVLILAPFPSDKGHRDLMTRLTFAVAKTQNEKLSARQLQWLNPPTDEVYRRFAETRRFQPASVALPLGAKVHWIGGGYVKPATTQLNLLWSIKQALPPTSAICLLSYSLAPDAHYPVQLHQAVLLLKYLVDDQGKQPENINLCGDSAGGNLILGLLSHLLHPHPSIPQLTLPSQLRGAALVSPWGDFSTRAPSFARSAANDSINGAILRKWSAYFLDDGTPTDNYNQPFLAPGDWWHDLKAVVRGLLVTAGTDEVLLDGIQKFAKTVVAVHPDTRTLFAPREFHDQPFLESLDDDNDNEPRSLQGKVLKAWLIARM
ncbi:MAG: hypothetical protein Q9173_000868 [Seirophora scorigena]